MKKQYRRRRDDSSDSEEDGGRKTAQTQSNGPPSKVSRQDSRDRDSSPHGSSRRRDITDNHSSATGDRDKYRHGSGGYSSRREEDERRRRRDYRDGGRGYVGRDSGMSYSTLAAGSGRGGERERDRDRDYRDGERALARDRDLRTTGPGRDARRSDILPHNPRSDGTRDRERDERKDSRNRHAHYDLDRERDRDRARDRDRDRGREPERNGADGGNRRGNGESSRSARDTAGPGKSKGIFSYIAPSGGANGNINNSSSGGGEASNNTSTGDERNDEDARRGTAARSGIATGPARTARPNSNALSSILRSDRRTNSRLDREQFDGAQTRLRRLAPEGDEVNDTFSTGCRPDLTGKKAHPFVCNVCPMSFPMATQLSDHLERSHGIFRHPSLITPNKSLSVGLDQDVHNP